jgi:hypothetical protein
MDAEVLHELKMATRSGLYSRDTLVEMFVEAEDDLDEDEVAQAIDEESERWFARSESWPAVTDVDKLEDAFDEMNEHDIIALMAAGYTQSDGYEDVCEIYAEVEERESVRGYCFYHFQDLVRAVEHGTLYLAFGPMDAEREAELGPLVGKEVVQILHKYGLKTEWDGTFDQRILVRLDWKRRPGSDEEDDEE